MLLGCRREDKEVSERRRRESEDTVKRRIVGSERIARFGLCGSSLVCVTHNRGPQ